jgi:DNA polymerase-3 subunit epsilon
MSSKNHQLSETLPLFAVIDIETTGGRPYSSGITEIAIILHDGEKIIQQYQTLINPKTTIPAYITGLTGISNQMVADAPTFAEVAQEIFDLTREAIFVAHNVNFDYSFLKAHFESIGMSFERKKLCTVRLSRKLFAGFSSYSLGNICEKLEIPLQDRHRALGDAMATALLFDKMLKKDKEAILKAINQKDIILPPHLPESKFENLPHTTGVYYFYNAHKQVIYVGKALDIKARIRQHFTIGSETMRNQRMVEEIHDIDCEILGNELIALLYECNEIKKLYPKYNQALKTNQGYYGLFRYEDQNGYIRLAFNKVTKNTSPEMVFFNESEVRNFVGKLVREFELCPKLCSLHNAPTACYNFPIGLCKGACCSQESTETYNARTEKALQSSKKRPTFAIRGKGRTPDEISWVVVENGNYKGFAFSDFYTPITTLEDIKNILTKQTHSPDTERIIAMYFPKISPTNLFFVNE